MMLAGKLEKGNLPSILKRILDGGKGGELILTHVDGKRSFLIDREAISGFQSDYPGDDLANFLYRRGILTKDEYEVLTSSARKGRNTEELIIHSEIIEEEILREHQADRVLTAISECDHWAEGTYEYQPIPIIAFNTGSLHVPLSACLIRILREAVPDQAILERLGGEDAVLCLCEGWQELASRLSLNPQEVFVISRIASQMAVAEILELVPFPREQLIPILHLLKVLGLVKSVERGAPPDPKAQTPTRLPSAIPRETAQAGGEKTEDQASNRDLEDRVRTLLEKLSDASHYEVLEVAENASDNDIKASYHLLARRYHPDRFYGDSVNAELRDSVVQLFEKIRSAYEVLREPESRREYDRKRSVTWGPANQASPAQDYARMAELSYKEGVRSYHQRDFFSAVQHFQEAVRLQPDVATYRAGLARAMMRNRRWRREAEVNYKRAIELDEFNAEHRVGLGLLYLEAGMPRKAEVQFREALVWDSENQRALKEIAKIEAGQQQASFLGRIFGGLMKKK